MRRALPHALLAGLVGLSIGVVPRPAAAKRKGPLQIVPEKKKGKERRRGRRAKDVDRSEAGSRRGVLELALGGVVAGTAGLLVGRGAWEIVRADQIEQECAMGGQAIECTFVSPGRQARIASVLNFGFAAVLGLTSGFLIVRGVRINRDYRKWVTNNPPEARLRVQPWATVRNPGAGLSLQLRF